MTVWTRAKSISAALTAPVLLTVLAACAWLHPRLPAQVPSHYDHGGQVDRWAGRDSTVIVLCTTTVGTALALWLTAVLANRRGDSGYARPHRSLLAAAPTVAATLAVATLPGLAWASVGGSGGFGTGYVVATLLTPIAMGILAWFALPEEISTRAEGLPAREITLPAQGRAAWTGSATNRTPAVLSTLPCLGGLALLPLMRTAPWWAPLLLTLPLLLVLVLGLSLTRLTVSVDARGVRWRSPAGLGGHAPIADLASVEVVDVQPMDYGGWGYRIGTGRGPAWVIRGGPALRITRRDRSPITLTVDDAATGAGLAQQLLARERSQA